MDFAMESNPMTTDTPGVPGEQGIRLLTPSELTLVSGGDAKRDIIIGVAASAIWDGAKWLWNKIF